MKQQAELKVYVILFDGAFKLNDIISLAECIVIVREFDMAPIVYLAIS